jgi:hypothetical protein
MPPSKAHELGSVAVMVWAPVVPLAVIHEYVPVLPSMAKRSSPRDRVLLIAEKVPFVNVVEGTGHACVLQSSL